MQTLRLGLAALLALSVFILWLLSLANIGPHSIFSISTPVYDEPDVASSPSLPLSTFSPSVNSEKSSSLPASATSSPFGCIVRESFGLYTPASSVMPVKVNFLADYEFGQTCNAVQIVSIAIDMSMKSSSKAVAFGPWYSRHLRALDIDYLQNFTKMNFMLDCKTINGTWVSCDDSTARGFLKNQLYPIATTLDPAGIYHTNRSAVAGFIPLIAYGIRPYAGLRLQVEKSMRTIREQGPNGALIIGVHRRWQEGLCPKRMPQYRFHECHPADGDQALSLGLSPNPDVPQGTYCNITFNDAQAEYMLSHSPALSAAAAAKKVILLLSTDGQMPSGDDAILHHSSPKLGIEKSLRLHELDTNCYNARKLSWRMMLVESWALTISDIHVGNPLSSCDSLIVHWRISLGLAKYSSFPLKCYEGFYDQTMVPVASRKPKF